MKKLRLSPLMRDVLLHMDGGAWIEESCLCKGTFRIIGSPDLSSRPFPMMSTFQGLLRRGFIARDLSTTGYIITDAGRQAAEELKQS